MYFLYVYTYNLSSQKGLMILVLTIKIYYQYVVSYTCSKFDQTGNRTRVKATTMLYTNHYTI